MSSMTFDDLVQYAKDVWNDSSTTAGLRKIKQAANAAIQDARNAADWPFNVDKEGRVVTDALYDTGTLKVTNGSTSVSVVASATWGSQYNGGLLQVDGDDMDYFIASATASAITLETEYQGDTASGSSYEIIVDTYDLPTDFGAISQDPYSAKSVKPLLLDNNWNRYHYNRLDGTRYGVLEKYFIDEKNNKIIFTPAPDVAQEVVFAYYESFQKLSDTSATIRWPYEYSNVLFAYLNYHLAKYQKKNNELSGLLALANETARKALGASPGQRTELKRMPIKSRHDEPEGELRGSHTIRTVTDS